ncbi:hypothetical protein Q5762_00990 [Streptomyces sp. P9(2023)]|uniref:hypothetical protein n=1 Tax=Streptomyces sp. P9(2023) TaxID=3064394 RepID=UPI0028F42D3F|nr:hypothetical protein [Streptomyces sp. P9(2023)]MDT9686949.1 hypothetical protein [Streptomyces sp. P9(2023)]
MLVDDRDSARRALRQCLLEAIERGAEPALQGGDELAAAVVRLRLFLRLRRMYEA